MINSRNPIEQLRSMFNELLPVFPVLSVLPGLWSVLTHPMAASWFRRTMNWLYGVEELSDGMHVRITFHLFSLPLPPLVFSRFCLYFGFQVLKLIFIWDRLCIIFPVCRALFLAPEGCWNSFVVSVNLSWCTQIFSSSAVIVIFRLCPFFKTVS